MKYLISLKMNSRNELKKLKSVYEKELAKKTGKRDLIWLMERVLGYPKMGAVHSQVQIFLQRLLQTRRSGLLLLPRTHLKTTEVTIAWTIQRILNNPDIRIFITNEKLGNAVSFLREIKSHFEKNEQFRSLYGDYTNADSKWTETQIIVRPRKKNFKEPTIQVGSVETSLVSQHYDLIIADDLVSRENINTKERMDKVKQYWKDMFSLLEPGGITVAVGTRWHYDDLYGQILKNIGRFDSMIRGCWDESGEPVFPEKFTKDALLQIKQDIGSYDFSCLYLNSPADNENADFKRSWMERRFTEASIVGKQLNTFVTIDNAPSTKKGTDFIGIIVNSVDRENKWYLRWVERYKGNAMELIEKMFAMNMFWKPIKFGVEQKAFQDLIKPFLDQEMRRRNQFFAVEELKDKGIRKEVRIRGRLQARFESGSIYLQENPLDNTDDLIDELVRFPVGEYDDLADALQYQGEIAYAVEGDPFTRENKVSEFGPDPDARGEYNSTRFHY